MLTLIGATAGVWRGERGGNSSARLVPYLLRACYAEPGTDSADTGVRCAVLTARTGVRCAVRVCGAQY
eukprot:3649479-Rhodomonas_salina.3